MEAVSYASDLIVSIAEGDLTDMRAAVEYMRFAAEVWRPNRFVFELTVLEGAACPPREMAGAVVHFISVANATTAVVCRTPTIVELLRARGMPLEVPVFNSIEELLEAREPGVRGFIPTRKPG
ncbi:MAG: hypothetical protein JXB46_03895 [Candidatus Eisenbacteria bacterium]|nr:hypothetical protein [Candidatus Eisenbacteria bacterium]